MHYFSDNYVFLRIYFLKYIIPIYIWGYNCVLMLNNEIKYFLYTHYFSNFWNLREMSVFFKWEFILLLFKYFDLL